MLSAIEGSRTPLATRGRRVAPFWYEVGGQYLLGNVLVSSLQTSPHSLQWYDIASNHPARGGGREEGGLAIGVRGFVCTAIDPSVPEMRRRDGARGGFHTY